MTSATFDRFDIASAHYLFWSEHHSGMFSEGYTKLCKALNIFKPSPSFDWSHLTDNAKDIYRDLCKRELVQCDYDSLSYILEDNYDLEDDCVAWFVEHYNDNPEDLCNYQTSDFINIDMCYTKDLLDFYRDNETSILEWLDQACDAYGYTSRLQLVEGQTIEDPDDLATAFVNAAMTYLGNDLYTAVENWEN